MLAATVAAAAARRRHRQIVSFVPEVRQRAGRHQLFSDRGFPLVASIRGEMGVGNIFILSGTSRFSLSPRPQQQTAPRSCSFTSAGVGTLMHGSPYASRTWGWLDVAYTLKGANASAAAILVARRDQSKAATALALMKYILRVLRIFFRMIHSEKPTYVTVFFFVTSVIR